MYDTVFQSDGYFMFATEWVFRNRDYYDDYDDYDHDDDDQVCSSWGPDEQHHWGGIGGTAHQEGCQAGGDDKMNYNVTKW